MTMQLSIATPQKHSTYSVDWLECQSTTGSLTILPGHAPLICSLAPHSPIIFGLAGTTTTETLTLQDAILHVDRHTLTIIGT